MAGRLGGRRVQKERKRQKVEARSRHCELHRANYRYEWLRMTRLDFALLRHKVLSKGIITSLYILGTYTQKKERQNLLTRNSK